MFSSIEVTCLLIFSLIGYIVLFLVYKRLLIKHGEKIGRLMLDAEIQSTMSFKQTKSYLIILMNNKIFKTVVCNLIYEGYPVKFRLNNIKEIKNVDVVKLNNNEYLLLVNHIPYDSDEQKNISVLFNTEHDICELLNEEVTNSYYERLTTNEIH